MLPDIQNLLQRHRTLGIELLPRRALHSHLHHLVTIAGSSQEVDGGIVEVGGGHSFFKVVEHLGGGIIKVLSRKTGMVQKGLPGTLSNSIVEPRAQFGV